MLQIIDSEFGGFGESDRAEMARDFDAVLVGGLNRGGKCVVRDIHVGLKRGHAGCSPEINEAAGFFGRADFRHLQKETAGTLNVRPSNIDIGADHCAFIDPAFDIEVCVGFYRAGGAHGGYAGS